MGVSEDGDGGGIAVHYSVGTIVWVRRRNGSWWPGRILGPEELSVSHLMSPRSGTPVKLLGREDASVDWYNLEKSKRVKAFRCGEFDGCIEKAESSLGVPVKKREKYARREDAILHALELERKQNEMKQQKQGIISDGIAANSLGIPKGEFTDFSPSHTVIRNEESSMQAKCPIRKSTLPRNANLLYEEENGNNSSNIIVGKDSKQIGQKEGISSTINRVKGLQDLCPLISPKKKFLQSVASPNTKGLIENNVDSLPSAVHIVRGKGNARSSNLFMSIKRKRSQLEGGLVEESLVKKRDRCRPLVQVLQSSAQLQASQIDHFPGLVTLEGGKDDLGAVHRATQSKSIYLPLDSVDFPDNGGYSSDDVQTPSNQFEMEVCVDHSSFVEDCTSLEVIRTNDSDSSLVDYLETEIEERDILGDTDQLLASSRPNDHFPSSSHKSPDMENLEMSFSGYHSHPYEHSPAEVGVSQWHFKGKRNSRCLVKRPFDVRTEKICASKLDKFDGSAWLTAYGAKGPTLRMTKTESSSDMNAELGLCHIKSEQNHASEELDLIGDDVLQEQMNGYNGQNYPLVAKAARDLGRSQISFKNLGSDSHLTSVFGWKADELSDRTRIELLEESDEFFDPLYTSFSRGMASNLFNVDLKVKTSYHGEHVPLVSLMSRFNGKAIIGHPVQVEILEDGSINQYFPSNHTFPDGNTTHRPVWRTARRTAMQRVPRSNPVTSSWENDEAIQSHYSKGENKCPPNVLFGYSKNQLRPTKKKLFYPHQPPSGNFLKTPHKKVNLPSQKTRTLSSFASEKKLGRANGEVRFARGCNLLGGLMKSEGQMPLITCVPAKVAFSRILEAVGRSSPTITLFRLSDAAIIDPS
ncbi:uncharacterized protein At1g51745-like [Zingiber officinale]|uniref:PWWP domain-containing protein n=1 Tax=Zingiber officinale TaxID=94328 RepID=A0A8J5H8Q9_ZINOF|nr:uncharacterized protein At1g51745-like [Zingiber officinale]XP_042461070.1 uncharacterized protein At1g51745-like [Zingiber officinale]KAG6523210.1 hypothetical protein ZIOFF_013063 [Zingiber officinale]